MAERKSSAVERWVEAWSEACQDLPPVRECRFHPTRRWRFDLAWPDLKVAVEVDGIGFGHQSIAGRKADNEKQNHAVLDGWSVFRFCTASIKTKDQLSEAVHLVSEFMAKKMAQHSV